MYTYMYINICMYTFILIYLYIYRYIYAYIYICIHIYINIYIHKYLYIHKYTYKHIGIYIIQPVVDVEKSNMGVSERSKRGFKNSIYICIYIYT
jgi:hypothetical protein